jgi:hypothetical protein
MKISNLKSTVYLCMVVHTCNPNIQRGLPRWIMSSRPVWATQQFSSQTWTQHETLSHKTKKEKMEGKKRARKKERDRGGKGGRERGSEGEREREEGRKKGRKEGKDGRKEGKDGGRKVKGREGRKNS